jgi:hypothetical protein
MDTNTRIAALATLDECLLAAHNAAVTGNAAAAIAIHRHVNEVIGHDGDEPLEITVMGVIYSCIKIAGVVAAQDLPPHALHTLDYGYGTVVPDTL